MTDLHIFSDSHWFLEVPQKGFKTIFNIFKYTIKKSEMWINLSGIFLLINSTNKLPLEVGAIGLHTF